MNKTLIAIVALMLAGCTIPDLNNDGVQVVIEADLHYTDNLGNLYRLNVGDDGTEFYVSNLGKQFVYASDGKLVLTGPDGNTVKVKLVGGE